MFQGLESDGKITEDALRRQIEDLKKKLKEKEWCLEAQVEANLQGRITEPEKKPEEQNIEGKEMEATICGQGKELEREGTNAEAAGRINETQKKLEEQNIERKEVEATICGQGKELEREGTNAEAIIQKLHKELQERDRASRETEATLCHKYEEIVISLTKTCDEKDLAIKELENKVSEEEFNWKTTEATYNPLVQDLYTRLEKAKMDKKEMTVGLHGQIKEIKKELEDSNKKEKDIRNKNQRQKCKDTNNDKKKVDPPTRGEIKKLVVVMFMVAVVVFYFINYVVNRGQIFQPNHSIQDRLVSSNFFICQLSLDDVFLVPLI